MHRILRHVFTKWNLFMRRITMQKKIIKLVLVVCATLALFLIHGKALADNLVVNSIDNKGAEIVRMITIIDPRTGGKTVINQPANPVTTGTGEIITTWPEYTVPEIKGYRPSQRIVAAKVVTPQTIPAEVTITYRPDFSNNLQDRGGVADSSGIENKKQGPLVMPKGTGQVVPTPKETNEAVDPLLGQKLKQLQAPLNELEDEHKMSNQYELPQTGNRVDTATTILGTAITAIVALTSLLLIRKKFNKFWRTLAFLIFS